MEIYRGKTIILAGILLLLPLPLQAESFPLEGRIQLAPPTQAPEIVPAKKNQESCGPEKISQKLLLSEDGGVQNVVIHLKGDSIPRDFQGFSSSLDELPLLNQKDCQFVPHILLLPKNRPFQIGNEDPVAHDVRAFQGSKMLFLFETDAQEDPVVKEIQGEGRTVIRCGLHPWMHAYVIRMEHPYYTVSDENGFFRLNEVPRGKYTLKIWHETLGEAELSIEIQAPLLGLTYAFGEPQSAPDWREPEGKMVPDTIVLREARAPGSPAA